MERTKKFTSLLMALILVCTLLPAVSSAQAASEMGAWDGKTIDVSWYNTTDTEFTISTPAQLMGLAAIVNGIYNQEIKNVIGDASYIVDHREGSDTDSGASTDLYHYGSDDFNGKTVYLAADLDMGGACDPETGAWSGPRYMPIGGQYLMETNDTSTKISSSFCGTLDGQGHYVLNIYCPRHCTGNYGDGTAIGLIGRLGVHDNDPYETRPASPVVRNLAVTGYIEGNRSIGGIVGKTGKTTEGAVIENCANYATVKNTDAKGCGGIAGAGWNGGVIRNCYNAGTVSSTHTCPTGGIVGSNEITVVNCYSVGSISAAQDSYAMAIGTTNSGSASADNCYWLAGSAAGGGYYGGNYGTVTKLSETQMKAAASKLKEAFTEDVGINNGYPILVWQADNDTDPLAPPPAPQVFFYSDMNDDGWYLDAVEYVMKNGLFDLAGEDAFGPDAPMTRLMLAEALYRLEGSPTVEGENPFSDTSAPAVVWAYEKNVVNGMSESIFAPDDSITREQIAVMLMRYTALSEAVDTRGDLNDFSDAGRISDWAADAMAWAVGEGLINGVGNGLVAPQGLATRAQAAQLLLNFAG